VADRVLDRPAFTAPPSELLALSKVAPDGDWPAVILRDQHDVSYDERGRATVRWRLVFVVRTRAGIDGWGALRSEWRPYYQYKPFIRARVIDPSGDVAEQEIVTIDREPMLAAGTIDTTPIGGDVPTFSTVIAYSAPAARKVHHV